MLDEEVKERINTQVQERVAEEIRNRWKQLLTIGVSGVVTFVTLFLFILNSAVKTETNRYVHQHFEAYDTHLDAAGLSDRIRFFRNEYESFVQEQERRFGLHIEAAAERVAQLEREIDVVKTLVEAAETELNTEQARATRFAQTLSRYDHFSSISNQLAELDTSLEEIGKAREFLTVSYNLAEPAPGNIHETSSCFEAVSSCTKEGFFAVSGACEGAADTDFALVTSGPNNTESFRQWVCKWCSTSGTLMELKTPPILTSQAMCLSLELSKMDDGTTE